MRNQSSTLLLVGIIPITANEIFWKSWIEVCELDSIFLSKTLYLKVQILLLAGSEAQSDEYS